LYPVVKFINVKFSDKAGDTWGCHEFWIGLDLLRSLFYWHVHPGLLFVDGLDLNVVQTSDKWSLVQTKFLKTDPLVQENFSANIVQLILGALSYMPEKVLFKNIHVFVAPIHARAIDFKDILILGQKKQGQYLWSAEANFGEKSIIIARLDMPLLSNVQIPDKGRLYLETRDLKMHTIPWYRELRTYLGLKTLEGEINAKAWIDWQEHHIANVHVNFSGEDLHVMTQEKQQVLDFPGLAANLLWQKSPNGWEVAVDHLNLKDLGIKEDKLLLYYQGDWNNYHFYIKELPLAVLKRFQPFLPTQFWQDPLPQLQGQLRELQLNYKDGQLDYFLTQFDELSVPLTAKHPGVRGLSGVFSWEPEGLRFESTSQNLELQLSSVPPIKFSSFHSTLGTQHLQDKTRLHIEHFVLTRPDMAITLSGEVDDPLDAVKRNLRLQLNWSLEHGEQWRTYLKTMLPASDLRKWLQNDVKRIGKSSGDLVINGLSQDFPYDHQNGDFSVNAYLYGVDLNFAPHWPMAKGIDGHLTVQGRNLEVSVDKAMLHSDLPVKQLSLVAPDLGLNREVLLIHGQLAAPVQTMLNYLMQTPLAPKAQTWQIFETKGQAELDLKLDIPLYRERDTVLTLGHLNFPEQAVSLNLFTNPLPISNMQGSLDFDGDGIANGSLTGQIGAEHFNLGLEHQQVMKRTLFHFKGGVDLNILKQALNVQTDLVKGHLPLDGELWLPRAKNQRMRMNWHSSLEGVVLDIPAPWHKTAKEIKPLSLDIDWDDAGRLNLFWTYENSQWSMMKQGPLWKMATHQDHLAGQASYDTLSGRVEANLEKLYLDKSLFDGVGDKLPQPWKIKDLPNLHVEVADFRWDDIALGRLKMDAKRDQQKWLMNELSISAPYYGFSMHGDISYTPEHHYQTQILAEMKINRLAKALEQWHITPVANTKDGYLGFQGGWQASLNQLRLKNLEGQLDVLLKKGNITHLDADTEKKIGLGKLLSILSLQTLPRRLQLDFSDLADTGFTFDLFKGHFNLHAGLLKTSDTILDGPIAHIKMQGDLNIIDRWYDLELQVYPYITASLPVVATIAGGPLAGVATWAANHVINQGMQKVSGYTYKITGPWQQPVVQQVHLERKH
jgi:uncharacterized protein YhdP